MYLTNTQIDISPLTNSTLNCVRSCVKEEYPEWSELNVKCFVGVYCNLGTIVVRYCVHNPL